MRSVAVVVLYWILVVPGTGWSWVIIGGPWPTLTACDTAREILDAVHNRSGSGLCARLGAREPRDPAAGRVWLPRLTGLEDRG